MSSFSDRLFDTLAGFFGQKPANARQRSQSQNTVTQHSIVLEGQEISYLLKHSNRRSFGFRIDDKGLTVTAPERAALTSVEEAISAKQNWILKALSSFNEKSQNRPAPIIWQDGAVFPYLGKECRVRLVKTTSTKTSFSFTDGWLTIETPLADPVSIEANIKQWLKKKASEILFSRLAEQAGTMQLSYTKAALSQATGRWGSCSSKKHIRLNWRLIMLDWSLIDYVIVHELVHLQEMNHSPRFWAIVGEWYPDWKDARKKLKTLGQEVFTLFAD